MSRRRRLPVGKMILWVLAVGGFAVAVVRFAFGLGAVTNLSDRFPWGLWVAFDVLCGVALAAGGFTMATAVHVFHLKKYEPLLRPAVLTGFLGYVLVIVGLLVDLGRPHRIWHALIMWNPRSVMFEVAWCMMLYMLVLGLKFGRVVLEHLKHASLLHVTRLALPPLAIVGFILSTMHQSLLGALFLIVPGKLHPLWYTPLLPWLFFLSAVAVGMAMVVVEAFLSARAFGRTLELPLLVDLGRATFVVLALYLGLKTADLVMRGALAMALHPTLESTLFSIEMGLGVILPLGMLVTPVIRQSAGGLAGASLLVVLGVVLNRLNVAITGMLAGSGAKYVPSWMEVLITLGIVAAGVLAYRLIAEHLPVFPPEGAHDRAAREAAQRLSATKTAASESIV